MCGSMFVFFCFESPPVAELSSFYEGSSGLFASGCFLLTYLCAIFALVNRQHCHNSLLFNACLIFVTQLLRSIENIDLSTLSFVPEFLLPSVQKSAYTEKQAS